jgi:hypothetical protein
MIEGIKHQNDKNHFDTFWKSRMITHTHICQSQNTSISDSSSSSSINLQYIQDMKEFDEHMEKIQDHVKNKVILIKDKSKSKELIDFNSMKINVEKSLIKHK